MPRPAPDLGRHLFDFAIVADTHMNEAEDVSASPFTAMRLANARTRRAFAEVDRLDVAFVLHLGDMINPVPALPTYGEAAERFREVAAGMRHPLHLVAGNHDVGDKPVDWMPAASVDDDAIDLYERWFGRHFYSFDAQGCHFVVLNSSVLNSGLDAEWEQRDWLEEDLADNADKRTFVFIHYPPYISDPSEAGTYDNIDEPGRSWVMETVARHGAEALFAGHVHNLFYNRHAASEGDHTVECYVLPSITFVRHDYSEFGRIGPADENGRNDGAKLGWTVVSVFENGHVVRIVRSGGTTLRPGETLAAGLPRLRPFHTKEPHPARTGVDLRHPWAETVEIPATGALDEFARKKARNDYPLFALWEMGVRKLRVPIQDLVDAPVRERMAYLVEMGHRFTVYAEALPERGPARRAIIEHADLIDALEIAVRDDRLDETAEAVAALKAKADVPVLVSKLRAHKKQTHLPPGERPRFHHAIDHGFLPEDEDEIRRLVSGTAFGRHVDGLVFRIGGDIDPAAALEVVRRVHRETGKRTALHVRMGGRNLAENRTDDLALSARVAEACLAALAGEEVDVFFDGFVDIDRGYFVRHGFVDRRMNPRMQARVFANVEAALASEAGTLKVGATEPTLNGRVVAFEGQGCSGVLVAPSVSVDASALHTGTGGLLITGAAEWIDLDTGEVESVVVEEGSAGGLVVTAPRRLAGPILVRQARSV